LNIGIDIGGTNIKAVLAEVGGIIFSRLSLPTEAELGPEHVIGQIHSCIEKLLTALPEGTALNGIGVGVPGSVDHARGIVLHPPNLPGWAEVPLSASLAMRWNVAVALDNDANCAALGEAMFGAGRGYRNFIGLTLGTGVGSGIIIDGKIHHGDKGYGGEFGHTSIDYNGPACGCGGHGCIEAYIGNRYLVSNARALIALRPECSLFGPAQSASEKLTPKLISEAAEHGDATALEILYETGRKLGIAIANAANLLDIMVFIIGGGVSAAGKPLFDGIISAARDRVLRVHKEHITILPAMLGNDAGMLGAASLLPTIAE
jgi:glucokinase